MLSFCGLRCVHCVFAFVCARFGLLVPGGPLVHKARLGPALRIALTASTVVGNIFIFVLSWSCLQQNKAAARWVYALRIVPPEFWHPPRREPVALTLTYP